MKIVWGYWNQTLYVGVCMYLVTFSKKDKAAGIKELYSVLYGLSG